MTSQKPSKHGSRQTSSSLRTGAICFAVAPLLGCQTSMQLPFETRDDGFTQALSSHQAAVRYSAQESIVPTMAVVQLRDRPESILSATERRYRNGFSQRVVYPVKGGAAGENWIDVRVVGRQDLKNAPKEKLALHSNKLPVIQHEAKDAIPGLSFAKQAGTYYQNAYGAYGLYVKQQKGNNGCLFGWQTLLKGSNVLAQSQGWPAQQGLSYRVRYCAKGLNLAAAQDVMDRITLAPRFARLWDETAAMKEAGNQPLSLSPAYQPPATSLPVVKRKTAFSNGTPISKVSGTLVPHPDGVQGKQTPPAPLQTAKKKPPLSSTKIAQQVPAP